MKTRVSLKHSVNGCSCVIKKFQGFNIVQVEFSKKLRQPFCPINIIYKPVKTCDDIVDCFLAKS